MYVKRLVLQNFRNYDYDETNFDLDRIYISGNNGIGKTNVIEAIYYLTLGRSFRKADDTSLIQKGFPSASIYLDFHSEKDDKDHHLSCIIYPSGKVFAYDDEKVKSISKILGKLIAVYYEPSLVFFFKDEPEQRRKLLDETCSQLSPKYLFALSRYKKILKERNAALQQNYDQSVIDAYRNELIIYSYCITKDRKDLVQMLSKKAASYYQRLFGDPTKKMSLLYRTTSPLDNDQESFTKHSLELFNSKLSLESLKKTTQVGPHRDDLIGLLNDNELATYGSQGENRIASLSLKLAILDILKEKLGVTPLLLLDDVTSDLDDIRCQNLLSCINQPNQQVFVTGTNIRDGFRDYSVYSTDGKTIKKEVINHE